MEKVKLTQEQAEAIKFALNTERLAYYQDPDELLKSHIRSRRFLHELEPLKEIDSVTLAKALYVGYEIEEPFKVGDWVYHELTKRVAQIDTRGVDDEIVWVEDEEFNFFSKNVIRHATYEEIEKEKERRKWAEIGRKVKEYKTNDIVYHEKYGYGVYARDQMIEPFDQEKHSGWQDVKAEELELICPAEQRFDMKEES